jgi:pantoate--beta-alanine ligase
MKVIEKAQQLKAHREKLIGSVGFVPTMGYLHEGHLALVRRARTENLSVVVSIFVNPTQFGPNEDFASYPRDTERDLAMLQKEKVNLVYMPAPEDIYPEGFNSWVEVKDITDRLEGKTRPGHFKGVTTVVAKLFNILEPDKAYFGQKDAQQLAVIQKMVNDLNMSVKLVAVPTVREPDGLAMSSRNVHLNPEERKAAVVLWHALAQAREQWENGQRDASHLRNTMSELIQKEPLALIDYISVADPQTLTELDMINRTALVSMAVNIGKTRLIDNVLLGE